MSTLCLPVKNLFFGVRTTPEQLVLHVDTTYLMHVTENLRCVTVGFGLLTFECCNAQRDSAPSNELTDTVTTVHVWRYSKALQSHAAHEAVQYLWSLSPMETCYEIACHTQHTTAVQFFWSLSPMQMLKKRRLHATFSTQQQCNVCKACVPCFGNRRWSRKR